MKRILILLLFSIITFSNTIAQCPMCKASVESNMKDGEAAVGMGLNTGILYLMVIPYIMVAAIGVFWYISKKKQDKNAPSFS